MLLFLVLFAIIGLHVFGGTGLSISEEPLNFDSFVASVLLVF